MNRLLIRFVALLLVPCLIADPVMASGFAHWPAKTHTSLLSSFQPRFSEQALQFPLAGGFHTESHSAATLRQNATQLLKAEENPALVSSKITETDTNMIRETHHRPLHERVMQWGTSMFDREMDEWIGKLYPEATAAPQERILGHLWLMTNMWADLMLSPFVLDHKERFESISGRIGRSIVFAAVFGTIVAGSHLGIVPFVAATFIVILIPWLMLVAGVHWIGRQYVAAGSVKDFAKIVATVEEQRKAGITPIIVLAGEYASTPEEAKAKVAEYLELAKRVGAQWPDPEYKPQLAVKLSALYPQFKEHTDVVADYLTQIAKACADQGLDLVIDGEKYLERDAQIAVFHEVQSRMPREWNGLGLVVQTYFKDSAAVIDQLIEHARATGRKSGIRIVKGAYYEEESKHPGRVWENQELTDRAFRDATVTLLRNTDAVYPMIASMNAREQAWAWVAAQTLDVPDNAWESQMLYGMQPHLGERMVEGGQPLRQYMLFGDVVSAMKYFARRRIEITGPKATTRLLYDKRAASAELAYIHPEEGDRLKVFARQRQPRINMLTTTRAQAPQNQWDATLTNSVRTLIFRISEGIQSLDQAQGQDYLQQRLSTRKYVNRARDAADTLRSISNGNALPALPILIQAAQDARFDVGSRVAFIQAMAHIAPQDPQVQAALRQLAQNDPHDRIKDRALEALQTALPNPAAAAQENTRPAHDAGFIRQGDDAFVQMVKNLQAQTEFENLAQTHGQMQKDLEEITGRVEKLWRIEKKKGKPLTPLPDLSKVRILGTDAVALSKDNFVFGFYSHQPETRAEILEILDNDEVEFNRIFPQPTYVIANQLLRNPDRLIRQEAVVHELLCPVLGHKEAIFAAQKIIPENYLDKKTGQPGHKYLEDHKWDREKPFKGRFRWIVRQLIEIEAGGGLDPLMAIDIAGTFRAVYSFYRRLVLRDGIARPVRWEMMVRLGYLPERVETLQSIQTVAELRALIDAGYLTDIPWVQLWNIGNLQLLRNILLEMAAQVFRKSPAEVNANDVRLMVQGQYHTEPLEALGGRTVGKLFALLLDRGSKSRRNRLEFTMQKLFPEALTSANQKYSVRTAFTLEILDGLRRDGLLDVDRVRTLWSDLPDSVQRALLYERYLQINHDTGTLSPFADISTKKMGDQVIPELGRTLKRMFSHYAERCPERMLVKDFMFLTIGFVIAPTTLMDDVRNVQTGFAAYEASLRVRNEFFVRNEPSYRRIQRASGPKELRRALAAAMLAADEAGAQEEIKKMRTVEAAARWKVDKDLVAWREGLESLFALIDSAQMMPEPFGQLMLELEASGRRVSLETMRAVVPAPAIRLMETAYIQGKRRHIRDVVLPDLVREGEEKRSELKALSELPLPEQVDKVNLRGWISELSTKISRFNGDLPAELQKVQREVIFSIDTAERGSAKNALSTFGRALRSIRELQRVTNVTIPPHNGNKTYSKRLRTLKGLAWNGKTPARAKGSDLNITPQSLLDQLGLVQRLKISQTRYGNATYWLYTTMGASGWETAAFNMGIVPQALVWFLSALGIVGPPNTAAILGFIVAVPVLTLLHYLPELRRGESIPAREVALRLALSSAFVAAYQAGGFWAAFAAHAAWNLFALIWNTTPPELRDKIVVMSIFESQPAPQKFISTHQYITLRAA